MRIAIPGDVVFRNLAGEGLLVHLGSGTYFGLNEIGTRFWQLLVEHRSTEAVIPYLLNEYAVDESRLRCDLDALIAQLLDKHLVTTDAGQTPQAR
jgi:coenzyme PQQ synthesis protein D (PqqD)